MTNERIPLGDSGYWIEGRGIYKDDEGRIKIATFTQFQARGQNQVVVNEFADAMNAAALRPVDGGSVRALERAEELLFAQGAPLGSDNYFAIRHVLRDGINAALAQAPVAPPADAGVWAVAQEMFNALSAWERACLSDMKDVTERLQKAWELARPMFEMHGAAAPAHDGKGVV